MVHIGVFQTTTRRTDTLAATAQQLGVSFYQYLRDRLMRAGQVPPVADLITERARSLNLGASWATS